MMGWLFKMRFRTLFYYVGCILILLVIIQVIIQIKQEMLNDSDYPLEWRGELSDISDPIILWWTPFTGVTGQVRACEDVKCFFTQDRTFQNASLTKAIMFYGTMIDKIDLPLPRNGLSVDWALLHEESPKNNPILLHSEMLALFNYSATFSRHSDFPLTLQYLKNLHVITDTSFFVPTKIKDELLSKLAPVVYVHSDCSTPLERDAYVVELMKYIPVDSYGLCIQNKKLPEHLSDAMKSMDAEEFLHFVARYKFTLSFENAVCEDYITEKLWRPLIVGSVPIYMGSPSVQEWLPNNKSAILASHFQSPKDLAEYLLRLNEDTIEYESFLRHKLASSQEERVSNTFLVSQLDAREWGIDNDYDRGNFVEHFECFVCRKVHEKSATTHSVVNQKHYYCPPPVSPLTGRPNRTNWWWDVWNSSRCDAIILNEFIDMGKETFTIEEFTSVVNRRYVKNEC